MYPELLAAADRALHEAAKLADRCDGYKAGSNAILVPGPFDADEVMCAARFGRSNEAALAAYHRVANDVFVYGTDTANRVVGRIAGALGEHAKPNIVSMSVINKLDYRRYLLAYLEFQRVMCRELSAARRKFPLDRLKET